MQNFQTNAFFAYCKYVNVHKHYALILQMILMNSPQRAKTAAGALIMALQKSLTVRCLVQTYLKANLFSARSSSGFIKHNL